MKKLSLQDQLLKAGLTSKSKANKIKSAKHKSSKQQQNSNKKVVNEVQQQADAARQKQRETDKKLNEERNKAAEKKQVANQIIQLINLNKLPQDDEGAGFNFTDDNKVKVIYLSEQVKNDLIAGRAIIAKTSQQQYEVVPARVAEKIAERDSRCLIMLADTQPVSDDYAEFEVPDDLMW